MSPLRLVGHILLWLGFFAGAFVTVRHLEVVGDKWRTIDWPLYALALCVGSVGVILLRTTARQASTHSDKLLADIKTLEVSVRELLARLSEMQQDGRAGSLSVFDIHQRIDARLAEPINDFVEARHTLAHSYGRQAFAQIMTDFSLAERNINRAWSASVDGYIDEVWSSFQRAEERFQAVARQLLEWKQRGAQAGIRDDRAC